LEYSSTDDVIRSSILESYGALEPGLDRDYQHIVQLAAAIAGTPMALVTFAALGKHWFKAVYGTALREAAPHAGFCQFVIESGEALTVADASKDARFSALDWVRSPPSIRFYCGLPLMTAENVCVGTLCVLDSRPRDVDAATLSNLGLLRDQILFHFRAGRVGKEVTELRLKIKQMSRLALLGESTLHIAHEINNPLSAIKLKVDMWEACQSRGVVPQRTEAETLVDIRQLVNRTLRTVGAVRSFGRPEESDPLQEVAISKLVLEAIEVCMPRAESIGVELRRRDVQSDAVAQCRSVQVVQVLVNLLGNAIDAVEALDASQRWIEIAVTQDRGWVSMSVTDGGEGIDPSVRDRVLGTAVTTKPGGKGTGLGLLISKAIATEHQGLLFLDSKSRNTRFVLSIPSLTRKDASDSAEALAGTSGLS
jgi:signal transduction histidine kinase